MSRQHNASASDVEAIERSTRYFAATDAEIGGALSREAAVGHDVAAAATAAALATAQPTR
jgi:hypothetical protein